MKKKLLAVAVAGVLAAPVAAFAQSSVTISGAIHMSIDNVKFTQTAKTTASEGRLNDESSSIIFTIREDLGGGMSAIAVGDLKPNFDSGSTALSGQSFIGLSTKTAGIFTAGRHNFHFFKSPWDGYGLGGALKLHPAGIIDFAGAGAVGIANATRMPNSLRWSSPNWSGFTMDVGYSFNPQTGTAAPVPGVAIQNTEADLTAGNTLRKGQAWTFNPTYTARNWSAAYSYYSGKTDAATAALAQSDQRSDSLYGYYTWGGFKLGAIWNTTKLKTASGATAGATVSDRSAWSIPIRYTWGSNHVLAHYTKARNDKATAADDAAQMWVLMFAHSLSKRTNVSLSYAKLTNNAGAAYNLFTNASSVNAGVVAGEDVRLLTLGMRHSF